MADRDDEVDAFDAMMGIDADEFATLLDDDEDLSDGGQDADDAPKLHRGGVPVLDLPDVTQEEFRRRFLATRSPVVLRDVRRECSPAHLGCRHFRERYGDVVVPLDITDTNRRDVRLADFLDAVASTSGSGGDEGADDLRSRYLRNLQMHEHFPAEAAQLSLPRCFGENMLSDEGKVPRCPENWRRWFELFVCHPRCAGFPFLHKDTCHVHAASFQLEGRKRFTLFHPDDSPFLYPTGNTGCRSRIDPEAFGSGGTTSEILGRFPALASARRIVCDVGAGEILFVPADWWHTARAIGTCASVSVAASFVDAQGLEAFLDAYGEFEAMRSLVEHGAGVIT